MNKKILISITLLYAAFFVSCKTNQERIKQEVPNWEVSIKKTPCLGECPVYKIAVNGSGEAELEVIKYMNLKEGIYSGTLDESSMTKLNSLLAKVSKKSYEDSYDSGFSDFPSSELTFVSEEGDTVNVRFEKNEAPKELEEIAELLDYLAKERKYWKPSSL